MANELTKDEKLEKLLKMAGFKLVPKKEDAIFGNVSQWWYDICNHWEYPDGKKYKTHPNLLHSLDAQEKYLVPVLREKYSIEYHTTGDDGWHVRLSDKNPDDEMWVYGRDIIVYNKNSKAQAFADAVLKLMEDQK